MEAPEPPATKTSTVLKTFQPLHNVHLQHSSPCSPRIPIFISSPRPHHQKGKERELDPPADGGSSEGWLGTRLDWEGAQALSRIHSDFVCRTLGFTASSQRHVLMGGKALAEKNMTGDRKLNLYLSVEFETCLWEGHLCHTLWPHSMALWPSICCPVTAKDSKSGPAHVCVLVWLGPGTWPG